MPGILDVAGVLVRFVHLASTCLLTGVFAFLVFVARPAVRAAGPAAGVTFAALDRRLLALAGIALGAAMGTGLMDLVRQTLVAIGSNAPGSSAPQIMGALLGETRYGDIWLVRQMLWLLLAALLMLRGPERSPADWLVLRLAGLVLASAGLVAGAAAGHAASAPGRVALAIAGDALHLLAAGIWAGAVIPLVLFLRWARAGGPDAPPPIAAVVAVRRFSTLGLLSVVTLLASGVYAVPQQVDSVPALLGTTYGRWLVIKLVLLVPLLGIAFLNRAWLRPQLEKASPELAGARDTGMLIARLGRFVLFEALLLTAMLGAVAVLGLTTPARHDPIAWPLPFRFSWDTAGTPSSVWLRVAVGGPLAAVGVVAALAVFTVRRRWWRPALVGGAAAVLLGLAVALPPLAVDAYPTTYVRPTVPYTTASILRGRAFYRDQCASCHGIGGDGDGPAAVGITPKPAVLSSRGTAGRTVGDLFWWIAHGVGRTSRGPGARLSPEQRWDVVNYLRTLSGAEAARGLTPTVSAAPAIVAPDVGYTTGVGAERFLRDYRGQTIVLLVFFHLPQSLPRLSRLADAYFDLRMTGVEILAVPREDADTIYRALAPRPLLFPFVIAGAEEAVTTYGLFSRDVSMYDRGTEPPLPVHMEMLIDRRGYLRARWLPAESPDAGGGWSDMAALLREAERLAREPRSAPALGEHIH